MEEKKQKMVPKYHYDQMEKSTRLRLRDEFLRRSGMSLITFYDKLRKDSFKPLSFVFRISKQPKITRNIQA